jgi:PAS domain S-box-containing protein/putative nucleotidyltransferase with HDIG domain
VLRAVDLPQVRVLLSARKVPVVALCVPLLFVLLSLLALSSDRFSDHPLILLTLPLVIAAMFLSATATALAALIASAVAGGWWLQNDQPGGWWWISSRVLSYFVIAASISQVVRSRRILARRLAAHSELSLDLIATASFDGYFKQVNPAFTTILGYTAEELTSGPLVEFIHPDDREATLAAIAEQAEAGRAVFQFQNRYRTKDGRYRWLEWTSRPDANERELIAVARDITERKRLERLELEQKHQLEQMVFERTRDLEKARLETLQRLALAAEYRDDDTHHHTQRVGNTAALIAERLGLDGATVELFRLAAPLHDVGKIAVSDTILLKRGRLTEAEFVRMQHHTVAGAALLAGSNSDVLQLAAEIALSHHERWDGNGYPKALRGEAIQLSGRIVAVADVFDALTHERPYKPAWAVTDAVDEINRLRGHHFDPTIVDAFLTLDHEYLVQPHELALTRTA